MYKMDLALINYNGWCAIPNQTKPNLFSLLLSLSLSLSPFLFSLLLYSLFSAVHIKKMYTISMISVVRITFAMMNDLSENYENYFEQKEWDQ